MHQLQQIGTRIDYTTQYDYPAVISFSQDIVDSRTYRGCQNMDSKREWERINKAVEFAIFEYVLTFDSTVRPPDTTVWSSRSKHFKQPADLIINNQAVDIKTGKQYIFPQVQQSLHPESLPNLQLISPQYTWTFNKYSFTTKMDYYLLCKLHSTVDKVVEIAYKLPNTQDIKYLMHHTNNGCDYAIWESTLVAVLNTSENPTEN